MNTDINWMDFNNANSQDNGGHNVSNPDDTESIKSRLHSRIEDVLSYLLPAGKIKHGKFHIGDIQGSPGDSMEIELTGEKTGVWYDHATGEGGDIFNLWASTRGMDTTMQFPQVMEDIRGWLGEPTQSSHQPPSPSSQRKKPPMDELGPHTGKWDYLDKDGSLLVCVYRYDPPGQKKQFRPLDVKTRKRQAPVDNRPLYNLPGIMSANDVVFVEGEKAAQALIDIGITASTSMHGSNGPVNKTDWSPLAGKRVVIWPDKDKAGWNYAETVAMAARTAGANVLSILIPPEDKPNKWDAADAVTEGMDIQRFLASAKQNDPPQKKRRIRFKDWTFDRYTGPPPERKWLIDGVLPIGVPGMVAAIGGAGKSMLLMDLAAKVALTGSGSLMPLEALGGILVQTEGTAVMLTAEDDQDEVHRRTAHLILDKPDPEKLIIIPLPNAGGAIPFVRMGRDGPELTEEYDDLRESLLEIQNLRLVVIDPLQSFAGGDMNKDPAAGSLFFSGMGRIAAETGATVLATHHFRKGNSKPILTANDAREAIRGTTALVDGGRWSYALWEEEKEEAKKICKKLHRSFKRDSVYRGAVVKSNWPADKTVRIYVREPSTGLLIDHSTELFMADSNQPNLTNDLLSQIAKAASNGQPFTKTGTNGLYERRSELTGNLLHLSKHRFNEIVDKLLESGRLVQCVAHGSKLKKWLDIPAGNFAHGVGQFQVGSGSELEASI
jgi:hypothetical protein